MKKSLHALSVVLLPLAGMAADCEVRLAPGGCHGVYAPGEIPELTLSVSNKTDVGVRFDVKLRTIDYFGNAVVMGAETFDVAAKGSQRKVLAYPGLKGFGFFCTVADWKVGEVSGTSEGSFVKVGPRPAKPDKLFGISCYAPNDVELYKRMAVGTKGVTFVYKWMENPKRPGVENCRTEKVKAEVKEMHEAGISVFGMSPAVNSRFPVRYLKKVADEADPVKNLKEFYADAEAFYRMLAREFGEYISFWVASSEINLIADKSPYAYDQCVELTRIFSRTVKSVIPGAVVLGIGVSSGDTRTTPRFRYMRRLARDLSGCIDGMGPDLYSEGQDYGLGQENLNSEQTRIRELAEAVVSIADEHGMKHVAINEKGPSFAHSLPVASPLAKFAADVVAREYIILKTVPRVDHWLYYRPFPHSTYTRRDWSMWTPEGEPRHVVAAYSATARLMAHAEFVKGIGIHADIPCWTFKKDGMHFATLWYNGGKPLALTFAGKPVEVLDAMGNAVEAKDGTVTLTSSPVYVYFKTAEELEAAINGARHGIPPIEAMLEMKSVGHTQLLIRNKSAKALSVKAVKFTSEPEAAMPAKLKEPLEVKPNEVKSVGLGISARRIGLSLDCGSGEPLNVRGDFAPIRVGRVGGWDDIGSCEEIRLDNPVAQMPGYADLAVHKIYNGPEDFAVSARFGYDGEALYMEYSVVDDVHSNPAPPAVVVDYGDSVQFCIDTMGDGCERLFAGKRGLDDNDFNFGAALAKGRPVLWCYMAGTETRARICDKDVFEHPDIVRDERSKATRYRIRIPFADIAPLKPEVGRVFGMSFLAFDYDPPEKGHYRLQLTDGVANPMNPARYRRFVFE